MQTLAAQLILHEGLRLEPYKCPAGYWTIGVGRNLEAKGLTRDEQFKIFGCTLGRLEMIDALLARGISSEEAMYLLDNDIAECVSDLEAHFPWFPMLDDVRKKVVVDMRFNLGRANFRGFKRMIGHLAKLDFEHAADEMVDSAWYREVKTRGERLVEMMRTGEDYK